LDKKIRALDFVADTPQSTPDAAFRSVVNRAEKLKHIAPVALLQAGERQAMLNRVKDLKRLPHAERYVRAITGYGGFVPMRDSENLSGLSFARGKYNKQRVLVFFF
jgi:hypothetical protein